MLVYNTFTNYICFLKLSHRTQTTQQNISENLAAHIDRQTLACFVCKVAFASLDESAYFLSCEGSGNEIQ